MSTDERPAVDPGLAPGGIWVRLFIDGELRSERSMTVTKDVPIIEDALNAKDGVEIVVQFFDGDSGEFMSRLNLGE